MWNFGSKKATKKDKAQHPLLGDHLTPPNIPKYTKNKRVSAPTKRITIKSIGSNSNSYNDGIDNNMEDYDYPHSVLSDSELNAPIEQSKTLPHNLIIGLSYESDDAYPESTVLNISRGGLSKSKSQLSPHRNKYNHKDDDAESNKSLPLNIASITHKSTRSLSLTSKQMTTSKLFRSKGSISKSASLKHRSFKKRKSRQKRYEYDSDCTSIYVSESDGEGDYFYPQLKRWRQRQNNWCCCKWKCCLEGSCFCECIKFIQKLFSFLLYHFWIIILFVFLLIIILGNVYAFSNDVLQDDINDWIGEKIIRKMLQSDWTFDTLLFSQIICIVAAILVLINIYLICLFYKMKRMNQSLLMKETKHNRLIDRGRKRREFILMQKEKMSELYEFTEKMWSEFWINHANFSFWNKIFGHNLNKMNSLFGNTKNREKQRILDEDEEKTTNDHSFGMNDAKKMSEYVSNLRKIYGAMKKYNKEIEGLQLKKLAHEIESDKNKQKDDMLSMSQFDAFLKKLPQKYQKRFEELRMNEIGNRVSCDKIHLLLTKILDGFDRNQSLSSAGPQAVEQNQSGISVTPMTSGYLQYGADDEFEEMLQGLATGNTDNAYVD